MKIKLQFTTLLILLAQITFAQNTETEKQLKTKSTDTLNGWKRGTLISLNLSQLSLTNWAAGGENSVAINGLISMYANYTKNKGLWENNLDLGYGTIQQGAGKEWRKSDDKIDFSSKYGRMLYKNLYYATILSFKSQMTNGYKYLNDTDRIPISKFMSPAYVLGAIGLDCKPKPNLSAFIAPLASKITIVQDDSLSNAGAYGVEPAVYDTITNKIITPGKKIRKEIGGYIRVFYNVNIMKNISLQTKLDLFSNYIKDPQYIDVNWENIISLKVNKYISATITTNLIYDHDVAIGKDENSDKVISPNEIKPRVQFKEVLGIGFSYKF